MRRDAGIYAIAILIELVGLATLLYGEETGVQFAIYGGGTVILIGVGIMTAAITQLEGPEEHGA